ncbi:MAG: deoxyribonuclease IV [Chlamydiota bacterium]
MTIKKHQNLVGAHMSAAGGPYNALYRGRAVGATAIQLFTSNQKQWRGKKISPEEVEKWEEAKQETGIDVTVSHDSYLINLGSDKPDILEKSCKSFSEEIVRCQLLAITYLNFHPGVATSKDEEQCLNQIVKSLLSFEKLLQGNSNPPPNSTRLLLETTAGQGNSVGYDFAHLAYIIQEVESVIPIGVCIDTCHIFSAGYDLSSKKAAEETVATFDKIIGLKHLYALHINDSKKPLGSRRDRHASLGQGEIGLEGITSLVTQEKISTLPLILETPEPALYSEEIALIKHHIESHAKSTDQTPS